MSVDGMPLVGCEHGDAVVLEKWLPEGDTHWSCPDCGEDWWD